MTNAKRWAGAAAMGLVLVGVSASLGEDWPQWRGPNRDGKAAFTAPQAWPKELTKKWSISVGSGDSSPALMGDKLYVFTRVGGDEVTLCLDAATGKEVWRDKNPAQAVTGAAARGHAGTRGSPAVAEGKVVTEGAAGVVSCLTVDGKLLWRKDEFPKMVPRFFEAVSPIIVDGLAIAQVGSEDKGGLIAFDLTTGEVKWKWTDEGPAYASPVLVTVDGVKLIVTLSAKSVVAVAAADGKFLWKLPFAPQGMNYSAATPVVDGQTVIVSGVGRGTKALKIEKQGDAFTTKEAWSNDKVAVQFSTPVLKDGWLYGLNSGGQLFCISAKTGEAGWTDTTKRGRGGYAGVVDGGAVILALPENSELVAFKPSEKAYTELAKYKVAETQVFAYPVVSGNKIYVKDADNLTLWTVE